MGKGNPQKARTPDKLHMVARSGNPISVQMISSSNALVVNSKDKHSRTPYQFQFFLIIYCDRIGNPKTLFSSRRKYAIQFGGFEWKMDLSLHLLLLIFPIR